MKAKSINLPRYVRNVTFCSLITIKVFHSLNVDEYILDMEIIY